MTRDTCAPRARTCAGVVLHLHALAAEVHGGGVGRAVYSVTAHLALLGRGEGGGRERSLARPGRSCARCRHPWPGPGEDPRSFSFSLSLYQSGRSSRSSDLLILSWGLRLPWQGSCVANVIY